MASLRLLAVCAAFAGGLALGGCQIWHVPPENEAASAAPPAPAPRVASAPAPAPTLPPPAPAPRVAAAPAPTLPPPAPAPVQAQQPSVAAPNVAAPPPPAPRQTASNEGDETVVVRGQIERQVEAPDGDPRTTEERMAHIRAWDRCVMRAQGAAESDPNRVQLDTPEDLCRESLGMANRNAIPTSFEP
jgi:hypothetical protein